MQTGTARVSEADATTDRRSRTPRSKPGVVKPTMLKFALGGVIPLGAIIWFLLLSGERRQSILDSIPGGASERAIAAAIAFGVLVALAWLALPAVYAGLVGTRRCGAWFRLQRGGRRVLLFPFEAIAKILHCIFGGLFATNAALIIGMFFLSLLFVAWIVRPDLLGGQERLFELARDFGQRIGIA